MFKTTVSKFSLSAVSGLYDFNQFKLLLGLTDNKVMMVNITHIKHMTHIYRRYLKTNNSEALITQQGINGKTILKEIKEKGVLLDFIMLFDVLIEANIDSYVLIKTDNNDWRLFHIDKTDNTKVLRNFNIKNSCDVSEILATHRHVATENLPDDVLLEIKEKLTTWRNTHSTQRPTVDLSIKTKNLTTQLQTLFNTTQNCSIINTRHIKKVTNYSYKKSKIDSNRLRHKQRLYSFKQVITSLALEDKYLQLATWILKTLLNIIVPSSSDRDDLLVLLQACDRFYEIYRALQKKDESSLTATQVSHAKQTVLKARKLHQNLNNSLSEQLISLLSMITNKTVHGDLQRFLTHWGAINTRYKNNLMLTDSFRTDNSPYITSINKANHVWRRIIEKKANLKENIAAHKQAQYDRHKRQLQIYWGDKLQDIIRIKRLCLAYEASHKLLVQFEQKIDQPSTSTADYYSKVIQVYQGLSYVKKDYLRQILIQQSIFEMTNLLYKSIKNNKRLQDADRWIKEFEKQLKATKQSITVMTHRLSRTYQSWYLYPFLWVGSLFFQQPDYQYGCAAFNLALDKIDYNTTVSTDSQDNWWPTITKGVEVFTGLSCMVVPTYVLYKTNLLPYSIIRNSSIYRFASTVANQLSSSINLTNMSNWLDKKLIWPLRQCNQSVNKLLELVTSLRQQANTKGQHSIANLLCKIQSILQALKSINNKIIGLLRCDEIGLSGYKHVFSQLVMHLLIQVLAQLASYGYEYSHQEAEVCDSNGICSPIEKESFMAHLYEQGPALVSILVLNIMVAASCAWLLSRGVKTAASAAGLSKKTSQCLQLFSQITGFGLLFDRVNPYVKTTVDWGMDIIKKEQTCTLARETLNLSFCANKKELKKNYRFFAKTYHPDKTIHSCRKHFHATVKENSGVDEGVYHKKCMKRAEQTIKKINHAKDTYEKQCLNRQLCFGM